MCVHHWLLDQPNGLLTFARCRGCGAERTYETCPAPKYHYSRPRKLSDAQRAEIRASGDTYKVLAIGNVRSPRYRPVFRVKSGSPRPVICPLCGSPLVEREAQYLDGLMLRPECERYPEDCDYKEGPYTRRAGKRAQRRRLALEAREEAKRLLRGDGQQWWS